jgi:tripartite-type tricarboxylate transporter receptor subunit TctC
MQKSLLEIPPYEKIFYKMIFHFFLKIFLSILGVSSISAAVCQTIPNIYPNKPITIIVPYSTGSTADLLARNIGNKLSTKWSVPVIIDNRPGAAGVIGTDAVAKAKGDGYVLLFTATSHASVPAIREKLPYDPIHSFTPICLLSTSAMGFVISPTLPFQNFSDFLNYVKSHPSTYSYSSPGSGTTQHLAMELLKQKTGMEILHVPYKGISGAITDVLGGHVQASIVSLQAANAYIQSGQLKMLAILSEERSKVFPTVPTLKQLGINEVIDTWYGVLAPAKMPLDLVLKLNTEMNNILLSSEIQELMTKQGLTSQGGSPDKMFIQLQMEIPKWKSVVKNGQIITE